MCAPLFSSLHMSPFTQRLTNRSSTFVGLLSSLSSCTLRLSRQRTCLWRRLLHSSMANQHSNTSQERLATKLKAVRGMSRRILTRRVRALTRPKKPDGQDVTPFIFNIRVDSSGSRVFNIIFHTLLFVLCNIGTTRHYMIHLRYTLYISITMPSSRTAGKIEFMPAADGKKRMVCMLHTVPIYIIMTWQMLSLMWSRATANSKVP
jgi:hypothetical protein